jgi:hypothetical protein
MRGRALAGTAVAALMVLAAAVPARADSLAIDSESYMPSDVESGRFYELVSEVVWRWDVGIEGESEYEAGYLNGEQTIGFSEDVAEGALGEAHVWSRPIYTIRRKKVCRRTSSGRRKCYYKRKRVFLFNEIVEQDITLDYFTLWQQGPAYPSIAQYDLETVLLHEVGHFANPEDENHVFGCENTPMIDALAPGDWWRAEDDWQRIGCANATGARYKRSSAAPRPINVVRHRLPARVRGD